MLTERLTIREGVRSLRIIGVTASPLSRAMTQVLTTRADQHHSHSAIPGGNMALQSRVSRSGEAEKRLLPRGIDQGLAIQRVRPLLWPDRAQPSNSGCALFLEPNIEGKCSCPIGPALSSLRW